MKNSKSKYYQIPNKSQTPNSKQDKVYDIKERTFRFAQRILEIVEMLPRTSACEVIRTQLTKSGTSIGANVEEADGTITKRDFVNKMAIARKETKETRYWLRLISGKYIEAELISGDIKESQEIINVLSAIINKTRGLKA